MGENKPKKKNKALFRFFQIALVGTIMAFIVIIVLTFVGSDNDNALDLDNVRLIQFETPADDAPVAVFETTQGTFYAVLYPDEAPEMVEYFTGLVEDGYYNGTYVYGVEENVYFIGGSKTKDGSDNDDTNTDSLEPEKTANLWPFKGALCSYGVEKGILNTRTMSGSRILFVNTVEFTDDFIEELKAVDGNEDVIHAFIEHGGIPNFAQQYTVFGQVIGGMKAYETICNTKVTDSDSKNPKEDIQFTKVYLTEYGSVKAQISADSGADTQATAD